jgi:hypothetical protein
MKERVDIITFGTFGNPHGFRQTLNNISQSKEFISIKTLDINTNALKLFQNTEMYAIRKDLITNSKSIALSKYVFVKEKNSDRGGTFMGSSILFSNTFSDENNTLEILNDFNNLLVQQNTENNTMLFDHSDKFNVPKSFNFEGLKKPSVFLDKILDWKTNNKYLVHFCDTNNLQELAETVRFSIEFLNFYDCIYFTCSQEIAKYVNDKKIYELSANKSVLEAKLQKISQETERLRLESISRVLKEIELFFVEQNNKSLRIDEELNRLNQIHTENQKKINKQNSNKTKFHKEIQELEKKSNRLVTELNSGVSIDEIKKRIVEYKRSFSEKTNNLVATTNLVSLSSPNEIQRVTSNNYHVGHEHNNYDSNRYKKNSIDVKTFISYGAILIVSIFILLMSYKLIFDEKTSESPHNIEVNIKSPSKFIEPNDKLNESDLKITNLKIKKSKSLDLDTIVTIIFKVNPSDITSSYEKYRGQYKDLLKNKNRESFDENNRLIPDKELIEIPCYKK